MQNILIVGAGPTGLTAALELARRGIRARVVDHKPQRSTLSRAVGINPHTLDLLDESRVTPELIAHGIKMKRARIHASDGGTVGVIRADLIPHRYNFMLALPQDKTEQIMHDRLLTYGGTVDYNTHVRSLNLLTDGRARVVLVHNSEETESIFDIVIAADGAHSVIREALAIPFPGHDYPTEWGIADFESPDMPYAADEAHMFFRSGKTIAVMIAIGTNRFRAVASVPDALAEIPGQFTVSHILAQNSFRISVRQAVTYQKGGVFLAGDAAHVHSPAGGRGMNLGIDDACDLARRVAEEKLEGYTAARHPVGAKVLKLSEGLVRGATMTNPVGIALRNSFLRLATHVPALQKPALKQLAGLD